MEATDYVIGYEEWHKRIAEAYRLLDSDLTLKSAVAQAHPTIWGSTAGRSLDYRVEDACASLDERTNNINRKKNGSYSRKIFLQDLYALCTATEKKPNDFLLQMHHNTADAPSAIQESSENFRTLLKYISRNRNMRAFIEHYYGKHNSTDESQDDSKRLRNALSGFDGLEISIPNDPIFMIAFKAEILRTISDVFQTSDLRSVESHLNQAEGHRNYIIDYAFDLQECAEDRNIYCDLIYSAFTTQEIQNEKIFTYRFLDDDNFFDYSWNDRHFNYPDLIFHERWNPKKRFELSLYTYILTCVLAAIVSIHQFYHADWNDRFVNDCREYISNNTAVRQLIKKLFLGSFLRFNDTQIVSAYGVLKPSEKKTGELHPMNTRSLIIESKQQKKTGNLQDWLDRSIKRT